MGGSVWSYSSTGGRAEVSANLESTQNEHRQVGDEVVRSPACRYRDTRLKAFLLVDRLAYSDAVASMNS